KVASWYQQANDSKGAVRASGALPDPIRPRASRGALSIRAGREEIGRARTAELGASRSRNSATDCAPRSSVGGRSRLSSRSEPLTVPPRRRGPTCLPTGRGGG